MKEKGQRGKDMVEKVVEGRQGLVSRIGIGRSGLMYPTAYDTAWMGRVPAENDLESPAFPAALEWLRQSQRPDGSWGGELEYFHDRIISTLAAILALKEWGNKEDQRAIEEGMLYIWERADQLWKEYETIGFEVILPTLVEKGRKLGLILPEASFERYKRMREEKLSMIPSHMLQSRATTLAFSLEFLGDDLDLRQTRNLQEINGSVGVSPSATAYLLTQWHDNGPARTYLGEVARTYAGKAPQVFPFDVFETSWTLWNLFVSDGGGEDRVDENVMALLKLWERGKGVGFSSVYSVVDVDVSSIVFKVLRMAGLDPDPTPLYRFQRDGYFICYLFERNPSVSANVHVLEALKGVDEEASKMVTEWLRGARVDDVYWLDKWHASPYYPTSHAVIAFIGVDEGLAREGVQWLLDTQQPDGGWGFYEAITAEETAYALQALAIFDAEVEKLDPMVLAKGREALLALQDSFPPLWIGKCLYTPVEVVRSSILSALRLTERFTG
jgi:halimadienyl-diphosphate synthase